MGQCFFGGSCMKSLFYFVFLILSISVCTSCFSIEDFDQDYDPEYFVNSGMFIWEQIDLVRAVKIADRLKEHLIDDIVDSMVIFYYQLRKTKEKLISHKKNCLELKELVDVIEENFKDVFYGFETSGSNSFCYLLMRIKSILECPVNVDA